MFCFEKLDCVYFYFGVVKFWDWVWVYYIVFFDLYWISIRCCDMVVFGDIFVKFYMYEVIFFKCMYFVGFGFVWF